MPDSWIDREEFEQLVGVFSRKKGVGSKRSTGGARSRPDSDSAREDAPGEGVEGSGFADSGDQEEPVTSSDEDAGDAGIDEGPAIHDGPTVIDYADAIPEPSAPEKSAVAEEMVLGEEGKAIEELSMSRERPAEERSGAENEVSGEEGESSGPVSISEELPVVEEASAEGGASPEVAPIFGETAAEENAGQEENFVRDEETAGEDGAPPATGSIFEEIPPEEEGVAEGGESPGTAPVFEEVPAEEGAIADQGETPVAGSIFEEIPPEEEAVVEGESSGTAPVFEEVLDEPVMEKTTDSEEKAVEPSPEVSGEPSPSGYVEPLDDTASEDGPSSDSSGMRELPETPLPGAVETEGGREDSGMGEDEFGISSSPHDEAAGVSLDSLVADDESGRAGYFDEPEIDESAVEANTQEGPPVPGPAAETPGEAELSQLVANVTVEDSTDGEGRGRRAPLFLGEAAELLKHRRRSDFEQDAARAVQALAEARNRAESSSLIREREREEVAVPGDDSEEATGEIAEEVAEVSRGDEEAPVSSGEKSPGPADEAERDAAEPADHGGIEFAPELDPVAEPESAASVSGASGEAFSAPAPTQVEPEPDNEEVVFETDDSPPTAPFSRDLATRVSDFAHAARSRLGASGVSVFDQDGYELYRDEGGAQSWDIDPVRLLRAISAPALVAGESGNYGPAQIHDGARGWHCFLTALSHSRHIVASLRLERPLESEELTAWSNELAAAIGPAND